MLVLIAILYLIIAIGLALAIEYLRYGKKDPDDRSVKHKKNFIIGSALFFFIGLLFTLPLISQMMRDHAVKKELDSYPIVDLIRYYQPDNYEQLLADVYHLDKADYRAQVNHSIKRMYERWLEKVPYSSTDAMMRFLRFHYDAIRFYHDNDACQLETLFSDSDLDLKYLNAHLLVLKDALDAVYSEKHAEIPLGDFEKIYAEKALMTIRNELLQNNIKEGSCDYYARVYEKLLTYPSLDVKKIIRYRLLSVR